MSAALRRSFASLELRNYRIYFTGQLVSLAGNWMQIVAELWLILALTGSGVAVGLATALQFTGILLFGALGGALADRFDKRRLLIFTQAAMAAPALAMFALAVSGAIEIWMVYALIAVRGLVLAVDNPTRQAFVIEIVGSDRVVNAVSLNSVLVHSARITGPALAGLMIALWGVEPAFAVNAATFVFMIAALRRMDAGALRRTEPSGGPGAVRSGLRYVASTPALRRPLALMAVLGTLGFNFQVILPLLASAEFGGEVSAYSFLMVAMGVGAIAGALVTGARSRVGPGVVAGAAAVFALASLAVAMAPALPAALLGMVPLGAAAVTFAAGINSGLQLDAAPEMRGRVMALYSIVFLGSTPLGGPLSGWVAQAYGPRISLLVGGAAAAAVALAATIASWRDRRGGEGRALALEPECRTERCTERPARARAAPAERPARGRPQRGRRRPRLVGSGTTGSD